MTPDAKTEPSPEPGPDPLDKKAPLPPPEAAPKERPVDSNDNPPTNQPPDSKADAQSIGGGPPRTGPKITVDAGKIEAENFKVVGNEIQNSYHFESSEARSDIFSFDMAKELPIAKEESDAKTYIQQEIIIAELLGRLQDRRIICLYGETGLGKDSTALFLTHLLRGRDSKINKPTLLVSSLEGRVRIDFAKIARNVEDYRGRPIIFRNALDRGNRDIKEFFGRIDGILADELSEELKEIGSFFVFTVTERTIVDEIPNLESVGIAAALKRPTPEILRSALDLALRDCGVTTGPADVDIQHITRHGRTIPRIFYCVRKYAEAIRAGLSISEAFTRIDDIETWFLRELPKNFESWRFALCLTLAQPLRSDIGVPWADFAKLISLLTPSIQRVVGRDEGLRLYSRERTSEDAVLHDARALIERDPVTATDVVRFQETAYVERIWATMLRHNRIVLLSCVSALEKCVEEGVITPLAARALRIIGRVGEIDPGAYLSPLVQRWSGKSGFVGSAKIGLLFEGAFATDDTLYSKTCERWLERLANSQADGETMAAVAICKQIGTSRLSLALKTLRLIAEKKLAAPLEDTQRIEKLLLRIEHEHDAQQRESGAAFILEIYHELLADLSRRVYAQQIPLIVSMRYALTSLFREAQPLQLVREVHQWGVAGGTAAALFSLLYLAKDGISDALAADGYDEHKDKPGPSIRHPILIAMSAKRDSATIVANFLEDVYDGFQHFFPPASARFFRKAYFAHLKHLFKTVIRTNNGGEELRAVMVLLMRSINSDLNESCHSFLTSEEIREDSSLGEFAQSILKAALMPRIGPRSPFARSNQH